jgi:outer membrane immunogenic protein
MKLKLIALALLGTTSIASAADLHTYTKAPALAPVTNWSGFYIGVMGGYSWSGELNTAGFTVPNGDFKGGFGGGTFGYNWQPGPNWMFGLEVDAAGADLKYSSEPGAAVITGQETINALGSVTGRVGYTVDAALLYVKGGFAWANNKFSITDGVTTFSETKLHTGGTIGAGLEYMFAPSWSAKVEYMYADFPRQEYFSGLVPNAELGAAIHTVKGGINYHFGPVATK